MPTMRDERVLPQRPSIFAPIRPKARWASITHSGRRQLNFPDLLLHSRSFLPSDLIQFRSAPGTVKVLKGRTVEPSAASFFHSADFFIAELDAADRRRHCLHGDALTPQGRIRARRRP